MIKSFGNKSAKEIWCKGTSRKLSPKLLRSARHKLLMLDAAVTLEDLAASNANNLEKRKGVRDTWSIRINDQYRVCFTWKQGDAYDVAVGDFHS
jgi:toxin HigB-1